MEQFLNYAPIIIIVVIFLIQTKVFIRPEDLDIKLKEYGYMTKSDFQAIFQEKRAEFQSYISNNYISTEAYYYNHDLLKDELKKETSDIKDALNKIDDKIEKRNIEDRKMLIEIMSTLANSKKGK